MNVNTLLECDRVLFKKYKNKISRGKTIQSFHRLGIKTVGDLINADPDSFTDLSRNQYVAIQNIFRNEYLGEKFAYEDIFNKVYKLDDDIPEIAQDIKTLGVVKEVTYIQVHIQSYLYNKGYQEKTIDMETMLRLSYFGKKDLANYYVAKLLQMRLDKEANEANTLNENRESIHKLKIEINVLNEMLRDLNIRIDRDPCRSLFEYRESLEIVIKDKQNELNRLKGPSRKRQ